MLLNLTTWDDGKVALLAEGVDRNAAEPDHMGRRQGSPSSRRAWIEISPTGGTTPAARVALLAEGVDRNVKCLIRKITPLVALLAEGVDRNKCP